MIVPPLLAYLGQTAVTVGQGLVTNHLQNQIENLLPQRNEDFEKLLEDTLNNAIEQLRIKYSSPVHTAIFTCIKATGKDLIFSDQSLGLRNAIMFGDPAQIGQLFAALFGPCIAKHLPERSDGLFDNLAVKFVECFDTLLKTEMHEKGWKAFHRDLERAVLKATAGEITLKTVNYEILVEINSKLDEQLSSSAPPDPPDYSAAIRFALSQFFESLNESVQALSNRVEELTQEIKERNRQEGLLKEEQKNTAYFRERTLTLESELKETKHQLKEALARLAERQSDPRDQEAIRLESEGKLDEAKSIWDEQEEAYAKEQEEVLQKRAENRLQRFHFLLRNHDWQGAEQDLLWGIDHSPASLLPEFLDASLAWTHYVTYWAKYEAALPTTHKLVSQVEQIFGESPRLATHLDVLASILKNINRLDEAEALIRRALKIDEDSFGSEHPNIARDLNTLAQILSASNVLIEAETHMRRALAIDESSFGAEHPNVTRDLNNLAQLLFATNRLDEAEPLMRRALTIAEKRYGSEHPAVAVRLSNLSSLLQDTNRLGEAEPLLRRALKIDEGSFGPEHPIVAIRLNNLAQLLFVTSREAEAEPLMKRALTIDESSFGPEHPSVARDLANLASLFKATNRLSEAESLMRRALAIDESSFGSQHPNVARDLTNLASLLLASDRLAEAEPLMRRALAVGESSFGTEHPTFANLLNNLAQLLRVSNRLSEAEPLLRQASHILLCFGTKTGYNHPHYQGAIINYVTLLKELNYTDAQIKKSFDDIAKEPCPDYPSSS